MYCSPQGFVNKTLHPLEVGMDLKRYWVDHGKEEEYFIFDNPQGDILQDYDDCWSKTFEDYNVNSDDISLSGKISVTKKKFPHSERAENLETMRNFTTPESEADQNLQEIYRQVILGNKEYVTQFLKKYPHRISIASHDGYYLGHLAVIHNRSAILQELVKRSLDLNVPDPEGKTPLHHAVSLESKELVSIILDKEVLMTAVDNSGMMPIHIAAEIGNVEIVSLLMPFHRNLNVKGEGGLTALHHAASNNHGTVIRLLIAGGASPVMRDDNGNYPIHAAAKNAAHEAIQAIVEGSKDLGYDRQKIMALKDREKNMPIHAAVNSGDPQTVKVCLKAGASILSQQEDGSTPLHFVAAQGNLEMMQMMYDNNRLSFLKGLEKRDVLQRTALHWATLFGHLDMMRYLLQKGANINAADREESTPLHIAASKGNLKCLKLLINDDANTQITDKSNCNFVHLLILSMEMVSELGDFLKTVKNYEKLIKARDCFGFTPFHYATKYGHLTALTELLKVSSAYNLKSNKRQTVYHLAAQFGRYQACQLLLAAPKGHSLKNEPDGMGMSPLHLASLCGQVKLVELLISKGVSIGRDLDNNTPLHLAASKGRVECIKVLLATHKFLLDLTNMDGDTPLHLAAANGFTDAVTLLMTEGARVMRNNNHRCFFDEVITFRHQEVALAIVQHSRWEEVFHFLSTIYGTFLIGLVQRLPHICLVVLDRCVTSSDQDRTSGAFYVEYNFTYLNVPENFRLFADKHRLKYVPLLPLQEMVAYNRIECLGHPLCVNFIRMKWRKYGLYLHFFEMSLYLLFLSALSILVIIKDSLKHHDPGNSTSPSENTSGFTKKEVEKNGLLAASFLLTDQGMVYYELPPVEIFLVWTISIFCTAGMVKEILIIALLRMRYISFQRILEWAVYLTSFIFAAPFIDGISTHIQWQCAALAVFLAWFNCLVYLQRFDLFGIYVVMFLEIMKTLVLVISIFSILHVAFGLAFFVLLHHEDNQANKTPALSIYRTLIFLIEFDFLNSINKYIHDNDDTTVHFPGMTYFLLAVFVIIMPLLLMNLLIGLAVGDIEEVLRGARLKRLATQVEFHSHAESRIPFLRRLTVERFRHYPNRQDSKLKNVYYRLVGGLDYIQKETTGDEETFLGRLLRKNASRLSDIRSNVAKNNLLMTRIMKRLHMNTEEEIWDQGGINIEGMGEPQESRVLSGLKKSKMRLHDSNVDMKFEMDALSSPYMTKR